MSSRLNMQPYAVEDTLYSFTTVAQRAQHHVTQENKATRGNALTTQR